MTDLRAEMQIARTRALRVRANVRALEAKLAAAEHAVQRDARRGDDPRTDVLVAMLGAERRSVTALGAELDERITLIDRACRALDAGAIAETGVWARAARTATEIRPPFSVRTVR